MFFRKFIWLCGLFLIGGAFLLTSRQDSAYQNGYAQGYVAGQQSVISEDGSTAVSPPQPLPHAPVRGGSMFSGLLMFLALFFGFMMFIGLMGMIFGRKHLRHHGRHWHGWQKDWHQEWQGRPPHWDDDFKDEPVMKA